MANVHDVAAYIVGKHGPMTAMKLQKLVYYSQAWHLVWEDEPLFEDEIQAWANGPVVRTLYEEHRGQFNVTAWPQGDAEHLTEEERTTIDAVLDHYGPRSSQFLSDLTHREQPWLLARGRLLPGQRGFTPISHASMAEYYSSLGK